MEMFTGQSAIMNVGSLSGSVVTSTAQVGINLTSLGVTDWIAYGYSANAASLDRKLTGGAKISALTQVGPIALSNFNYASNTPNWMSSWTDGTITGTVSNEAYVAYVGGAALGDGMSLTSLADTAVRTLKVYLALSSGAHLCNAQLTATLSDGSAGPYTDASVTENTANTVLMAVYTIVYSAASAGQILTVTWLRNDSNAGGNVDMHAAALS